MHLTKSCPICKSIQLQRIKQLSIDKKYTDQLNKINKDWPKNNFFIELCMKCGFIFENPRFTDEDYYLIIEFHSKPVKFPEKSIPRAQTCYNFISKYYEISNNFSAKPSILDFGGQVGQNLYYFLDQFDCYLLDFANWILPEGVTYLGRDFSVVKEKNIKFDAIISTQVFEHVNDLRDTLKSLINCLKDGGVIYTQVPLGCLREWKSKTAPFTHINFFSEQSLYNFFTLAGLSVMYLKTNRYPYDKRIIWNLDIVAIKNQQQTKYIKSSNIASTEKQMNNLLYLFIVLIRMFKLNHFFFLKKLKTFKNKMISNLFKLINKQKKV